MGFLDHVTDIDSLGIEWSPKIGKTTFASKGREEQIPKIIIDPVKGEITSVRDDITVTVSLVNNSAKAFFKKAGKPQEQVVGDWVSNKDSLCETLVKMAGDIMLAYTKETSPQKRKDLQNAHTMILEELLSHATSISKNIQRPK